GLGFRSLGDLDRLVDRDLECQGLVTELLPLVGHRVEDDVLILEDAVGDDVVLLQIENRVVVELAVDLDLLAVDLLPLPAHIGLVLGPAAPLTELLSQICLAVVTHFHGRSSLRMRGRPVKPYARTWCRGGAAAGQRPDRVTSPPPAAPREGMALRFG